MRRKIMLKISYLRNDRHIAWKLNNYRLTPVGSCS